MFKRITAADALEIGFTNHGSYFGIPLWITDSQQPMVTVKFGFMNNFFDFANQIEGFLFTLMYPDSERVTVFNIGKEIKNDR